MSAGDSERIGIAVAVARERARCAGDRDDEQDRALRTLTPANSVPPVAEVGVDRERAHLN